jgi:hypothetical protein
VKVVSLDDYRKAKTPENPDVALSLDDLPPYPPYADRMNADRTAGFCTCGSMFYNPTAPGRAVAELREHVETCEQHTAAWTDGAESSLFIRETPDLAAGVLQPNDIVRGPRGAEYIVARIDESGVARVHRRYGWNTITQSLPRSYVIIERLGDDGWLREVRK